MSKSVGTVSREFYESLLDGSSGVAEKLGKSTPWKAEIRKIALDGKIAVVKDFKKKTFSSARRSGVS